MTVVCVAVTSLMSLGQLDPLTHLGSLTESLRSPARLAVAVDGTVLVTDPFNNRIARFDVTDAFVGTWSVPDGPIGIAAHPDGRYFVSLRDVPKVAIYDDLFNFVAYLGDGVVTLIKPTDIDVAVDTGRIYVVDSGSDQIHGFESNGMPALTFGIRGELPGQLQYPSAISVDETNGRIVVTDHDNYRVQTFTPSGYFQQRFGYRIMYIPGGDQEAWMPRSQGVTVDAAGYMYLADAMMSRVRILSPAGIDQGKVIDYGSAPGDIFTPCDVALSNDGLRLYVASTNTASVEVYATPALGGGGSLGNTESAPEGPDPPGTNRCPYGVIRKGRPHRPDGRSVSERSGRRKQVRASRLAIDSPNDTAAQTTEYDGPHFIDSSYDCSRCHGIYGQPGSQPGGVEGQTALCASCHSAGGQALSSPMHVLDLADPFGTNPNATDGRGRSHAWGVSADEPMADAVSPTTDTVMGRFLDDGKIKCTTCHNQHDGGPFQPYLRVENTGDAMCKECHAARNKGPGEGGSHPVGFDYPGGVGEFPADGAVSPLLIKDGNVECMTCHGIHNADSGGANDGEGDGMLLRTANDETLCQTCHVDHVIHTPSGDWQPTCKDCHGVHESENTNLSLVSGTISNQTLGVDKPVVFTAREGANSFDDGDPTNYDGICQVCHTATGYHKHDGSGSEHHDGEQCTACHPHDAGFMPTGGTCTDCHAAAQDNGDGVPVGGRRAIVGEFPVGDAHAHYGTELTSGACTVCHDQTTHMDGNVDLLDADTGALYTFVMPSMLTSDPDLSDFCASCHDADGATRLGATALDPFGGGNAPPDVASKFQGTLQWDEWYGDFCFGTEGTLRQVNSHHDISDTDQAWSGARIECLSCHGAHSAGDSQPVSDPFQTTSAWTGTMNEFCLECHWGGFGPDDPAMPADVFGPTVPLRGVDICDYTGPPWYVDHSWTHAAPGLDSKRAWNSYSGAPGAEVECLACHDPHGSYTVTNTLGNPYAIRDAVDGTIYVDDGVRPGPQWTGPPWDDVDSQGTLQDPVVVLVSGTDVSWSNLCVACHANWQAAYSWHDYCSGCQTCHGHGQAWQNYDWGAGNDDHTFCPYNNRCDTATGLTLVGDLCDEASGNVGAPCTNDGQCTDVCDEASDNAGTPCTNDGQCTNGLCGSGLCDRTFRGTVSADTTVADDDSISVCGGTAPTQTLWYSVAGTGNTMTVTTCKSGTTFDTNIRVFCDTCDSLTCVTSNDDAALCGSSAVASTVSFCSDANQTYLIQVGGSNAEFGTFELYVLDEQAPCGAPDGCSAVPAPLSNGPDTPAATRVEGARRTAPHPVDGTPMPLHGADAGR